MAADETYRMYGATLLAIVRNSASVSGSFEELGPGLSGGEVSPGAPSDP